MPTFEEIDARSGSVYQAPGPQPVRTDAIGNQHYDALSSQYGVFPSGSSGSPASATPSASTPTASTPTASASTPYTSTPNGTVVVNPTTGRLEFAGNTSAPAASTTSGLLSGITRVPTPVTGYSPTPTSAPATATATSGTNGTVTINPTTGRYEFVGGGTSGTPTSSVSSSPAPTSGTSNGTVRINPDTGLFEFVGGGATGSTGSASPAYSAGTSGSSGSTTGSGGLISGTPSGSSYAPNTNRQVDARNETIEGRINGLLSADNPVMQQAGNRAMQQFQGRGLLNSSMAIQAANEAMVSRAIEIAGPDAATYNKTGLTNQSEANQFARAEQTHGYNLETDATRHGYDMETDATRQGYEQANLDKKQGFALETQNIDNANLTTREREGRAADSARIYSEGVGTIEREGAIAIDNINKSDMTPAQKTAAIAQRRELTTQNLDAWNAASKSLPGWSDEWAVIPVTTPAFGALSPDEVVANQVGRPFVLGD